jgi:hypothetical protein
VSEGNVVLLSIASKIRLFVVLLGICASGSPAVAATINATVNAGTVKPLTVSMVQSLSLGTITLGPGTWTGVTISLSRAGVFSCSNPKAICSGATQAATYNVQGSNGQTVRISAPNVTMVNQSEPVKTLTLVTDAPATIILTNSGQPGLNFSVGGSITISSTTAAGTYVGAFNVTCDY